MFDGKSCEKQSTSAQIACADGSSQASMGFVSDAWGALSNTFKSQANGAIQLTNHVLGTKIGELELAAVGDPNTSWGSWSASLVGQAGAMSLELLTARKLGVITKMLGGGGATTALEAGSLSSETTGWQRFASGMMVNDTPAARMYSSLAFGAINGGVFTPSNDPEHFWQSRFNSTASGMVAVGSMAGISLGSAEIAGKLASGKLASTLANGFFNNAVGGYAGGVLGDLTTSSLTGKDFDWAQAHKSGVEFALVGIGSHSLNLLPEQRAGTNITNARYLTDKIGLTSSQLHQQVEFHVTDGSAKLKNFYERRLNGDDQPLQAEITVRPKIHTLLSGIFGDDFTKYGAERTLFLSHNAELNNATTRAKWIATCSQLLEPALQARDVFGRARSTGPGEMRSVWLTPDADYGRLTLTRGFNVQANGELEPVQLGSKLKTNEQLWNTKTEYSKTNLTDWGPEWDNPPPPLASITSPRVPGEQVNELSGVPTPDMIKERPDLAQKLSAEQVRDLSKSEDIRDALLDQYCYLSTDKKNALMASVRESHSENGGITPEFIRKHGVIVMELPAEDLKPLARQQDTRDALLDGETHFLSNKIAQALVDGMRDADPVSLSAFTPEILSANRFLIDFMSVDDLSRLWNREIDRAETRKLLIENFDVAHSGAQKSFIELVRNLDQSGTSAFTPELIRSSMIKHLTNDDIRKLSSNEEMRNTLFTMTESMRDDQLKALAGAVRTAAFQKRYGWLMRMSGV